MGKNDIKKTNAARLLDKAGIAYELIPYSVDENNLAADHVAEALGEDIRQVFKTIVLHGEKVGHFVCVVPGDAEIDLKKAASAAGAKKAELIPMKELLPLTGYIRGGMLAGRNEKTVSDLLPFHRNRLRLHLRKRRTTRPSVQNQASGPDRLRRSFGLRYY